MNTPKPGKTDTFILDFINTKEDILKAFQIFYKETYLTEEVNVDLIYQIQKELKEYELYFKNDIEKVVAIHSEKQNSNTIVSENLLSPQTGNKPLLPKNRRQTIPESEETSGNMQSWVYLLISSTANCGKKREDVQLPTPSFVSPLQNRKIESSECKVANCRKEHRPKKQNKWTGRELNPWPRPCQGRDLPLIYRPKELVILYICI